MVRLVLPEMKGGNFFRIYLYIHIVAFSCTIKIVGIKHFPPPNEKKLSNNFFIDKTFLHVFEGYEPFIRIIQYKDEIIITNLDKETYIVDLPNNKCLFYWDYTDYNKILSASIVHPQLPMIGITYPQALAYTQWRTDKVLERQLLIKKHIRKKDYTPDKQPFNIHNAKIFYPELTTKDIYYYEFSLPDSVHIAQSYDSISIFKEIYRIKDYLFKTTKSDSTFNTLSFYQFTSDSLKVYDLQNRIMKPINTIDCKRDLIFLKNISTIKKL